MHGANMIKVHCNMFLWLLPLPSSRKSTSMNQITAIVNSLFTVRFTPHTNQNITGWIQTRSTLLCLYISWVNISLRARTRYIEQNNSPLNMYSSTSETITHAILLQLEWVLLICVQQVQGWCGHEVIPTVCVCVCVCVCAW